MSDQTETLWNQFEEERSKAASTQDAEALRIKYLGKKGPVTALLKSLGTLAPDQRKAAGEAINHLKARLEEAVNALTRDIAGREEDSKLKASLPDHSLPGTALPWAPCIR